MSYAKRIFNKAPLSIDEQLVLLQQRGLIINDREEAGLFLSTVGYYRLSAYFKPFQIENDSQHPFKTNVNFSTISRLYHFDRKLRLHILDAIERIEVAFRVAFSNNLATRYSAIWYTDASHFKNAQYHLAFMARVADALRNHDKPYIKHYFEQYDLPEYPPSWMLIECLSFGSWSKAYRNLLRRQDKKAIADVFGQPFIRLESWLQALTDLRNMCAHHERVWNRIFLNPPQDTPREPHQQRRFYQLAYAITHLLISISPDSQWQKGLFDLLSHNSLLPLTQMGFIQDWQNDKLWEIA